MEPESPEILNRKAPAIKGQNYWKEKKTYKQKGNYITPEW